MIGQKGVPAKFGGVETHVENLSKNLANRDHEISVYSRKWYTEGIESTINKVKTVHTPTINTKHLDTIVHTFTATIHSLFQDYDVIHYHAVGPSLLAWIPRLFSNKKIVSTFHCIDRKHEKWGWFARKILTLGEWAACKFPHKTIVVSKGLKKYTKENYNCNSTYIPNGVPLYEKNTNTDKIKQWGLQKDNYIFLISRFIPHKGIHYAIKAYKKLKEENIGKKLVITGGGHHTDKYTNKIEKMVADEPNVILTGFQSNETLEQLFSNAYMMLSPSDAEGLPITMLEGMSYRLPIVASDIDEHRELIQNEQFLFEQGNVDSLKQALEQALNKDNSELKKEADANRKNIEENFAWSKVTKEIERLYKNL